MKETRFKQTEIGLIPEDWSYGNFADFLKTFTTGATPLRSIKSYYEGNIKWVSSGELNYRTIYDTIEHITESAARNTNLKTHEKGTFLMAITGLEAEGTRGKCAILGTEATTNQSCLAINSTSKMTVEYLYYYYRLNSDLLAFKYCQGSKQQSYTAEIVKKLPLYCPKEILEQKKIASALTSTDNLLLSLEKLIEKKRLIKQGAMQDLLTGKKRLPGFTGEWVERQVKDIGSIGRGRVISQKEIERSYQHKYPVYSSQTQNNGIMGYIDTYDFEGEYITWTTDGVNAGTVFYRNGLFNCTNVCGTIKLHKDNHLFVSMRLGLETNNYVSTNLANPKLMNNVMKQIVIDLPETVEEQKAIASVLSSMDKEIESLEGKKAKYEQIKQGMMQQLLTGKIRLI